MNLTSIRAQFEPIRFVLFGGIGANYVVVGTPLANPAYHMVIENLTDQPLLFSLLPAGVIPAEDGTDDHVLVPSQVTYVLDINTNKTNTASALVFAQGTQVWVEQFVGAPTTGLVVVSVLYAAS